MVSKHLNEQSLFDVQKLSHFRNPLFPIADTIASGIKKNYKKNRDFSFLQPKTVPSLYLHMANFYFIQYQFLTMGLGLIKITAEPL